MRKALILLAILWCSYSHASEWEVFRYDGEYTVTKILPQGDATVWLIMGGRLTTYNRLDGSLTYHDNLDGPAGRVNELALDNNGELLTAGTGGVYRYDGHSWSLLFNPDDNLFMLFVTQTGIVWAVSPTALYRYEGDMWELTATGTFVKGTIDNDGTLWFVTDAGLESTSDGVEWINRYDGLTSPVPKFLYIDKENVLWVPLPYYSRIAYYDDVEKDFIEVQLPSDSQYILQSIIMDNDALWTIAKSTSGTTDQAVWEISPSFDSKNVYTAEDGIVDDAFSALALSDDGTVWIGSRFGLTSYDGERFVRHIAHKDFFLNTVTDIAIEGDTVWFGHHEFNRYGYFSYFRNDAWHYKRVGGYRNPLYFPNPPPLSVVMNGADGVWLSGPSALNYYDYTTVTHYDALGGNNHGIGGHPGDVRKDMYGNIWIVFYGYNYLGTDIIAGLTQFTGTEFKVKDLGRKSSIVLFGDTLYFADPYGYTSAGTGIGEVSLSSLVNNTFDESVIWHTPDTDLPTRGLNILGVDNTGVLWASRWYGDGSTWDDPIEIYRRTSDTTWDSFTAAEIGTNAIRAFEIVADSTNVMWFGTDAGVLRYDGDWTVYTTENSALPHDYVYAIAVAPDNAIWFGTADGAVKYTGEIITAVDEEPKPETLPTVTSYPNPFNPSTTIGYSLSEGDYTRIEVFDVTGQIVETLVDEWRNQGRYSVVWDASGQAAGLYFCRVTSGANSEVMKMMLVK